MKALKPVLLLIIVAVCLSFLACKQGNDVTGKWKNINMPETVEFRKDSTGTFNVQNNPSLPFTWKKLKDGRIELLINFMGNSRTLYGRLEKSNTFVLAGQGEQAIYNRID
ncbi:hypothetical protein Geob_3156 [Geotalea daltonii FRC-32]|uniref:Lipocalin-like domain-containing protein n=1 Tax=Geotalea daltonii (strain DSM 22248 / JCM 15807 / FRC-32) TaxID=316067 RepID=B9M444_GEODF|nr:hypothetical protein [Geotalea daltonii]ACM21499.1 hypothetical protein Geob_3156 [Geotalea daltonii FRC-32]